MDKIKAPREASHGLNLMIQLGLFVLKPGSNRSSFSTACIRFSPQPAKPAGWEVNTPNDNAGCPVIGGCRTVYEVFATRKFCPSAYLSKQQALVQNPQLPSLKTYIVAGQKCYDIRDICDKITGLLYSCSPTIYGFLASNALMKGAFCMIASRLCFSTI